jgi:hypothetical protein
MSSNIETKNPIIIKNMIFVLQRNNPNSDKDILDKLVNALSKSGQKFQYLYFDKPLTELDLIIEKKFQILSGSQQYKKIDTFITYPSLRKSLRKITKIMLMLFISIKIFPVLRKIKSKYWTRGRYPCPRHVKYLIDSTDAEHIHLIALSAGGITAALVSNHPKVKSLTCIGYPLRHPYKKKQRYRTHPLGIISKPCIIVQGNKDEYGNITDIEKCKLSDTIKIFEITATHSYENIIDEDMDKIYKSTLSLFSIGDQ